MYAVTVTDSVTESHVAPLSDEISILYAVIGAPPVRVGASQESAMVLFPDAVAVKLVGAPAIVAGVPDVDALEPNPALVTTVIWK